MTWTILKLLQWTEDYFKKKGLLTPRLDAEILLAHVLQKKRIDLYLAFDRLLSEKELSQFKTLIQRRVENEPIAYIVGKQEFWSLDFKVGSGVLIPRPETECLVEEALQLLKDKKEEELCFLDVGTGCGALAIVLGREFPKAKISALDISEKALEYAATNAKIHGVADRIQFQKSDLLSQRNYTPRVGSFKFDLVISNPPYLTTKEWDQLDPHIKKFEPKEALCGGEKGVDILLKILENAQNFLTPKGWLILEIAPNQVPLLRDYVEKQNIFLNMKIIQDYTHRDRVMMLELP